MSTEEKAGRYMYLVRNPVTAEWREVGVGQTAAEVLGENHNDVVYVRVPLRSWDPRVRETVTVTRVRTMKADLADEEIDPDNDSNGSVDPADSGV